MSGIPDIYGSVVEHLLGWIDAAQANIPGFNWILAGAVCFIVLIFAVREMGKSVAAWRRPKDD